MAYQDVYDRSIIDPQGFWSDAAAAIDWDVPWDTVLDDSNRPMYRWFTGGKLNTCHNAVDRHVHAGRAEQLAVVYDSAMTGTVKTFTYSQLLDAVSRFAGGLARLGVGVGDRVVIYMPMVPEAIIAMLACSRIGAIHSVVFGGFAARELAKRIDDAKPKVILSASCGLEVGRTVHYKPLLDRAIDLAEHKPQQCIILQRPEATAEMTAGRDLDWQEHTDGSQPAACVSVESTHPLYILYTSGTTGIPKGVVRDHGGHAVALKWSMEHIYGLRPGDTYWAASDVGWVVGHSYIVYAPLLHGCTTVLYEGKPVGTPDPGAFWRVIADHHVNVLFTAPTAFRAIRRDDPQGACMANYDLSTLRALFLAGERCDPATLAWAQSKLNVPVIDHWWQTETGWPVAANCLGIEKLPVKPGSAARIVPGYTVDVLGDNGQRVAVGQTGAIVIKTPLPPGCLSSLWQQDQHYIDSYLSEYDGYYNTGDAGMLDEDGYLWIMGRTDDIINVAGHRLSTGAMEEVLASHSDVAECAVVGANDEIKGELPIGFVVLKSGSACDIKDLRQELVQLMRDRIGPIASFKNVAVVARLPKTRSGKILRATMKQIANGESPAIPATIDDPAVLEQITDAVQTIGYGKRA